MTLPQEDLIARLKQICQQDRHLLAAMHYGSFARQDADRFSDLDIMLFFEDGAVAGIDQRAWLEQIAPVELFYVNEFGNSAAIFSPLVRGEFHFDPASEMDQLGQYRGRVHFPTLESTLLVDKTGRLAQHLQPLIGPPSVHESRSEARYQCQSFLNWTLFGINLLARGEYARSLEVMPLVWDNLLRMVRIEEQQTIRWIIPAKELERDISPAAYRRFQACTAPLEPQALQDAYRAAWLWGNELMLSLAERYDFPLPNRLIQDIGHLLDR